MPNRATCARALVCLAALFAIDARSQEVNLFQNLMIDYTRIDLNNQLLERAFPTQDRTRDLSALMFQPSAATHRANLARFAAKVRGRNPELATELTAMMTAGNVMDEIGAALAPQGLRTNNIADAHTAYLISAWLASRGRFDTPTRASIAAVQAQLAGALLATPEVLSLPDAGKQEFAEAMLLQTTLIESAMQASEGRAAELAAIATAVRAGAKALGIDLDQLELTDAGFVPRG